MDAENVSRSAILRADVTVCGVPGQFENEGRHQSPCPPPALTLTEKRCKHPGYQRYRLRLNLRIAETEKACVENCADSAETGRVKEKEHLRNTAC
jgi:hypothetical protein